MTTLTDDIYGIDPSTGRTLTEAEVADLEDRAAEAAERHIDISDDKFESYSVHFVDEACYRTAYGRYYEVCEMCCAGPLSWGGCEDCAPHVLAARGLR